jgi:hypothetical protein
MFREDGTLRKGIKIRGISIQAIGMPTYIAKI